MHRSGRLPYLLIPVAALIPVLPLILFGCSCGHDFDFHILNWLEAARQLTHGIYPHWAYTPAYNAGEPRFVFYPPLSWTLGAILGTILPWTWTPIVYTWLVLTAAGLTLHRLARAFTTPTAALLASVFYLVNPYTLFTAYERTAYAELLAAVWIPLLLQAILSEKVTLPRIALPVALLWLTNAPAAVMSCYALALLTAVRLILTPRTTTNPGAPSSRRFFAAKVGIVQSATAPAHSPIPSTSRAHLALITITGTTLGLGLAAFYLIPAAYERRYVQINMAILPGLRIQDNFLFHHTTQGITNPAALSEALFHDQVLHTASLIAVVLLILTTITLLILRYQTSQAKEPGAPYLDSEMWASRKARPHSSPSPDSPGAPFIAPLSHAMGGIVSAQPAPLYALAILAITIAILLTPLSNPIWHHTPELAFLQFPWRLLAILAVVLSLTLALTLRTTHLKPATTTAIALTIAAALTYPAYTAFHQPCDPEDTVTARTILFHSSHGSEPTDEYTPITADNDALTQTNPPYWLSSDPNAPAPTTTQLGPAPTHLTVNSPTPQILILNLRDYPTWHITLNQTTIPTRIPRTDGLIALPLDHAADFTIDITPIRTLDQTLGYLITLVTAILLLILAVLRHRKPQPTTSN